MKDYLSMSIVELHEAIIKGEISPLELVELAINKAKQDTNNAFEYICEKEAIEEVNNLDINKKDNLLWGIPYALKDNFSTKDIPTTGSSDLLKNYVPVFSCEVYLRLKEQGAILIGKTSLDELAMGGGGSSGHLGRTYNPWDPTHKRMVGGSSSGSAACCAAGIVPFAIGSDTGDSARKPASYAALVGLKPTWGRISRFGLFPFAPSLDHVGFFTRNVTDCAIVLSALAGKDEKDLTSSNIPTDNYHLKLNRNLDGIKVAIIDEIYNSISDKCVRSLFDDLLFKLEKNGVQINHASMDINLCRAVVPTYLILSSVEATNMVANLDGVKFATRESGDNFEEIITNTRTKNFAKTTKERLIIGGYALNKDNQSEVLLRAQKCRRMIVDAINNIFKENDLILLPSAPGVAHLFDEKLNKLSDEYLLADNLMSIANFGGQPSISLPLGFEDNLPLGVNVMGKLFDESLVLAFAKKIEKITGLKNLIAGKLDE